MKKSVFKRNTLSILLAVMMVMAMLGGFAFADTGAVDTADTVLTQDQAIQKLDEKGLQELQRLQDLLVEDEEAQSLSLFGGKWVTVRILGYEESGGGGGVILDEYKVRLTDSTGYTVVDALEKACGDNNISLTVSGSGEYAYVTEIGGQEAGYFEPNQLYYSGWMYRVWENEDQPSNPQNDILPWDGAGAYTLDGGEKITWYYALPTETWYTIMDNYEDIGLFTWRGQTIDVNVKGQKYTDIWYWELTDFVNINNATVTLTNAFTGSELASAVTGSDGNAALTVPAVGFPTLCFINVEEKYYTTSPIEGGIEHTKSWRKPVIVIW